MFNQRDSGPEASAFSYCNSSGEEQKMFSRPDSAGSRGPLSPGRRRRSHALQSALGRHGRELLNLTIPLGRKLQDRLDFSRGEGHKIRNRAECEEALLEGVVIRDEFTRLQNRIEEEGTSATDVAMLVPRFLARLEEHSEILTDQLRMVDDQLAGVRENAEENLRYRHLIEGLLSPVPQSIKTRMRTCNALRMLLQDMATVTDMDPLEEPPADQMRAMETVVPVLSDNIAVAQELIEKLEIAIESRCREDIFFFDLVDRLNTLKGQNKRMQNMQRLLVQGTAMPAADLTGLLGDVMDEQNKCMEIFEFEQPDTVDVYCFSEADVATDDFGPGGNTDIPDWGSIWRQQDHPQLMSDKNPNDLQEEQQGMLGYLGLGGATPPASVGAPDPFAQTPPADARRGRTASRTPPQGSRENSIPQGAADVVEQGAQSLYADERRGFKVQI